MRFLPMKQIGSWASIALAACVTVAACGSTGETQSNAGSGGSGGEITGAGGAKVTSSSSSSSSSSGGDQGGAGGGEPSTGPYPFVLAHGFFGFNDFAGLGFETYFFDVKDHLAAQGEIVETPAVDPFNSSEVRGQQLIQHIEDLLALTGAKKVNIIGHSQGGLDARVVAHERPDLVASVVTVATPHFGSPVADVGLKLISNPQAQQIIDALVNLLGGPIFDQIGNTTSISLALKQFSKDGITAFNAKFTDSPGVYYASISGRSAYHAQDNDCTGDVVVPFIKPWNTTKDPMDPLLGIFGLVLAGNDNAANDGLVRARDGKWGEYWGCVPADHLDEVGQLLGDGPGLGNDWDHLDFYTQLIAYMRSKGY